MSDREYQLERYHYELPQELIAQSPAERRDFSRLMIIDRVTGEISEAAFHEISSILAKGDRLILNDTKVIPARLLGKRRGGGEAEIFLLRPSIEGTWQTMVRPGRKLGVGASVTFGEDFSAEIVGLFPDGTRRVRFSQDQEWEKMVEKYGKTPLPPYIKQSSENERERYQTIYAKHSGGLAAPTAGLHFTREILQHLEEKGVDQVSITLHPGLGTFKPVQVPDIREHPMHEELFSISEEAADALNRPTQQRSICVGTTCCRALESVVRDKGSVQSGNFATTIFIYPGYSFNYVQTLLTNFHLPCSTLLMLVSAFAGYELIREAYAKAIERRFRFFSYGDAMLIL